MWATNSSRGRRSRPSLSQSGTAAVEFALLSMIFFTFIFGVIEVARLMYVYNTLQEVTRRAAAAAVSVYPNDALEIAKVKQDAVFRNNPGELAAAPPITDAHVRLTYLRYDLSSIPQSSWPSDAANNKRVCMLNPRAANCIRFVQAQVCDPAITDRCEPVRSQMIFPIIDLRVPLHRATTIATVESLGYVPGTSPCPCP